MSLMKPAVAIHKSNGTTQTVPAMRIQYFGSSTYGGAAVAAGGDLTLYADDTDGVTTAVATIDLSSPAVYTTFGALVDYINSLTGWRAFLVGVKRSDSTDNTLAVLSATGTAKAAAGIALAYDEQVGFKVGHCISRNEFTSITNGPKLGDVNDAQYRASLTYLTATSTYGSGTSTIIVTECDDVNRTETELWRIAGGATTAAKEVKFALDYGMPIICKKPGTRLLVQVVNSAAETITAFIIAGGMEYYGPGLGARFDAC